MPPTPPIILASGSSYRRGLLSRLALPFTTQSPDIDESPRAGESAPDLALRLSREKALAIAGTLGSGLVIGSDQVADCDGVLLGKPGNRERAIAQLRASSGRVVTFWTGVALANATDGHVEAEVVRCDVHFRRLAGDEIARYVDADQPWDCAGSFRSEGLGVVLFEKLVTDDPSALVGLPLIALCRLLRAAGVRLPAGDH